MFINGNDRDIDLIVRQCELQKATTPKEVAGFTAAYLDAKLFACRNEHKTVFSILSPDNFNGILIRWAGLIDPINTGWRKTPVVTRWGLTPTHHTLVEGAIKTWIENYLYWMGESTEDQKERYLGSVTPTYLYKEFEKIHPLIDGNGRLGHLIWAIATFSMSGLWPITLPPDVFGDKT